MLSILFYALCGYVVGIIAPVPWISRAVLDIWAKIGAYIAAKKSA